MLIGVETPIHNNDALRVFELRVFVGENLYLIKPMQRRFWLRVAALADGDGIALDLQQTITSKRRRSAGLSVSLRSRPRPG
jgi:hypothetical protein